MRKGADKILILGLCCIFLAGCAATVQPENSKQNPAPQVQDTAPETQNTAAAPTETIVEGSYEGVKDFDAMLDYADAVVCCTVKETWHMSKFSETARLTVSKVYAGEAPDELILYQLDDEYKLKMDTTYVLFLTAVPDAPDEDVYCSIGGPQGTFVLTEGVSALDADGSSSNKGVLENEYFTETDKVNDWFAQQP